MLVPASKLNMFIQQSFVTKQHLFFREAILDDKGRFFVEVLDRSTRMRVPLQAMLGL
jgi:hypothetical protein